MHFGKISKWWALVASPLLYGGPAIFIDREAREIMYLVVSVRPSVNTLCNQSAYADNRVDAVDRLLII